MSEISPSASAEPGGSFLTRPFARLWLFIRQIFAELRKVVRPTRSQLVNYTIVVIVFVIVMMIMVSLLDFGFSKLMVLVFGSAA